MKSIVTDVLILAFGVLLSAIVLTSGRGDEPAAGTIGPASKGFRAGGVERYGPDEFGVVCYRKVWHGGISCVKVSP